MKTHLHHLIQHLLFLYLVLGFTQIQAQSSKSETRKAIRIQYVITHDEKNKDIVSFTPYSRWDEVHSPPYNMVLLGTFRDHGGYLLSRNDSKNKFYCLPDTGGIAFLPTAPKVVPIPQFYPIISNDLMLLGHKVEQQYIIRDKQTVHLWRTTDSIFANLDGIKFEPMTLRIQRRVGNSVYHINAVEIDTILLHPRYFKPELHHSPLSFSTDETAFRNMAFRMGPSTKMPKGDYTISLPYRKPLFSVPDLSKYETGDRVKNYKGKLLNESPFNLKEHYGRPVFIMLLDYEIVRPLPEFVPTWLTTIQKEFPTTPIFIFSASSPESVKKVLVSSPGLNAFQHFIISKDEYIRYKYNEPLTYVVLDRNHRIQFLESAFDIHSIHPILEALKIVTKESGKPD